MDFNKNIVKIMSESELSSIKKKILYRTNYRGIKESDLILGGFTKKNIDRFSKDELEEITKLIELSDYDLLNWIMGIDKDLPIKLSDSLQDKFNNYRYCSQQDK